MKKNSLKERKKEKKNIAKNDSLKERKKERI